MTATDRRDAIMVLAGGYQQACCLFVAVFGPEEETAVLEFLQAFEHGSSGRFHLSPPPSYPWFTFSTLPGVAEVDADCRSGAFETAVQVARQWSEERQLELKKN